MNFVWNARLPRSIQRSFICRKSTTWDRRLYFPSEGRSAEEFFALKNPTASAGFETANLRTKGQHATPRPPKTLHYSTQKKHVKETGSLIYLGKLTREGKETLVQVWTASEGSRRLRLPEILDNQHMKMVGLSALRTGNLYPPRNIPSTHFCYRLSRPHAHSADGRIMSMKNSNDTIGNRTLDLPACSAVPQQTAPPRAPKLRGGSRKLHYEELHNL